MYIYTYIHTHIYIYIHTYVRTYIHTYIHRVSLEVLWMSLHITLLDLSSDGAPKWYGPNSPRMCNNWKSYCYGFEFRTREKRCETCLGWSWMGKLLEEKMSGFVWKHRVPYSQNSMVYHSLSSLSIQNRYKWVIHACTVHVIPLRSIQT
jgi:hypothetical protein